MNSLSLDDVSVTIGRVSILKKLNYVFPSLGIVSLIGPNGSGKSTLLDVMSGFRRVSSGRLCQQPLNTELSRNDAISEFARLHQVLLAPDELTVAQYLVAATSVNTALRLFTPLDATHVISGLRQDQPSIFHMLSSLGVHDLDGKIGNFSWGQKRSIALAAVLGSGKHLLLDEPLAGLAANAVQPVIHSIQAAAKSRLVIVAEHNIQAVKDLGGKIIVLVCGRITKEYSAGEEFESESLLTIWLEDAQ